MIKLLFKIFAILILVIFQVAVFNKIAFYGIIPNIILILGISFILKDNFMDAFLIVGLGGLFLDLGSPLYFGLYTLLFIICILAVNYLISRITEAPNYLFSFLIFFACFTFIGLVLSLITKQMPSPMVLIQGAVNGLWGVIIYYLTAKVLSENQEVQIS